MSTDIDACKQRIELRRPLIPAALAISKQAFSARRSISDLSMPVLKAAYPEQHKAGIDVVCGVRIEWV